MLQIQQHIHKYSVLFFTVKSQHNDSNTRELPDREGVGAGVLAGTKQVASLSSILHQQAFSYVTVGIRMKPAAQDTRRRTKLQQ